MIEPPIVETEDQIPQYFDIVESHTQLLSRIFLQIIPHIIIFFTLHLSYKCLCSYLLFVFKKGNKFLRVF